MDGQHTAIVPCGQCPACLKRRADHWAFRLFSEMKQATSAAMLTLTYEDRWLPRSFNGHATLQKRDFQLFMKRLRKKCRNTLKYYACGEYGGLTNRPHYHLVMFNLPSKYLINHHYLEDIWQMGGIHIAECNMATIRYTTKYVMKGRWEPEADDDDRAPLFSCMSKKLGMNHLTPQMVRYYTENMLGVITLPGGALVSMPRYYKEKIFSKRERKILAEMAAEYRDMNMDNIFRDVCHEIAWKKDQYRKAEKAVLQRIKN